LKKNQSNLALETTSRALGSSKDCSITSSLVNSKKVVVIKQEVRSSAEYQELSEESVFSLLPFEMKRIDKNLTEEIGIESDEQEKEIVRVYFDNDWDKYRRNLKVKNDFNNYKKKKKEAINF
jgi:hypothetical protein